MSLRLIFLLQSGPRPRGKSPEGPACLKAKIKSLKNSSLVRAKPPLKKFGPSLKKNKPAPISSLSRPLLPVKYNYGWHKVIPFYPTDSFGPFVD